MSYRLHWVDEAKTILQQTCQDEFTVNEYYLVVQESARMLASVSHPVDIIIDVQTVTANYNGFLSAVRYANKVVPANQRLVILVGATAFLKAMTHVAEKIAPNATDKGYMVDTLEQAHQLITEYRAVLTADEPE